MSTNPTIAADADTFDRSCAHWSDAGVDGMHNFYTYATADYAHLAKAVDWPNLLSSLADAQGSVELADIACGSGKFPTALVDHTPLAARNLTVKADLLDPSQFAIDETAAVLKPPFEARAAFCCKLQDWQPPQTGYDINWSMHALYCVPAEELLDGFKIVQQAMKPHGIGFVAQSRRDGHYVRFYDYFLESLRGNEGTPFSASEDVAEALQTLGFDIQSRRLTYDTVIDENDRASLELYLQRCAFDDSAGWDQMQTGSLGAYLNDAHRDGAYRFTQSVDLIAFGKDLSGFDYWITAP